MLMAVGISLCGIVPMLADDFVPIAGLLACVPEHRYGDPLKPQPSGDNREELLERGDDRDALKEALSPSQRRALSFAPTARHGSPCCSSATRTFE